LIEGIPLIEIIRARREGNDEYLQSLADRGYDLDMVVRTSTGTCSTRCSCSATFHADLHPATCSCCRTIAIGYVDFGIVGQLPDAGPGVADRL
jgi:predicted unusual protein kinase regulating ubiquinone biosynthesis (AarF/ABC1/UbiB family)